MLRRYPYSVIYRVEPEGILVVAVVTGASKGIGASIAKALAEEGAAVVVNYSSSRDGADRVVADIVRHGARRSRFKATSRSRPTSPASSRKPRRRSAESTSS